MAEIKRKELFYTGLVEEMGSRKLSAELVAHHRSPGCLLTRRPYFFSGWRGFFKECLQGFYTVSFIVSHRISCVGRDP